ncbi:MAG: hypothetical protein ACP5QK_05685 [Myxococcota bacterium]
MNLSLANRSLIFILLWGSALSVTQTVLLREYLCIAEGNEISIGLVLSIWLLSNAIGAFIWVFLKKTISAPAYIFPVLGFFFSSLSIIFLRYAKFIFDIPPGTLLDVKIMLILTLLSISLPSLISGISFPFLCAHSGVLDKKNIVALVYGIESMGLVIGYLLAIFAFGIGIGHFVLLFFSYGISFLFSIAFQQRPEYKCIKIVLFLSGCVFGLISTFYIDKIIIKDSFLRQNKGYEFLSFVDTNYNRYILTRRSEQYALFVNNRFSKLIGDDYNYKLLAHLLMSVPEKATDVLIVGEASLDILRHIKEHDVRIDYVEYDGGLIRFLQEHIVDARKIFSKINIIFDDGRRYIKGKRKRYDVVIMDISEPINLQLNRFYSVEFFGEVKEVLKEDGILLISLPSVSSVPSEKKKEFLVSVYGALKNQFRVVKPFEYDRTYLLSSESDFDLELNSLVSRYKKLNISDCDFEPEIMSLALQNENNERILKILEQSDGKINSDLNPEGMFLNLILWEMSVNSKGESFLLHSWYKLTIVIIAILLLPILLSYFLKKSRYLSSGILMFYQGLFSMAVEFIIIYKFQVEAGTIYYFMALLFSLFMSGLTVGSVFFIKIKYSSILFFAINLLLPISLLIPYQKIIFLLLLLFLNGALTGIIFGKLSTATSYANRESIIYTASIIDYSDSIGAMLSAIAVPLILLPIIGVEYLLVALFFVAVIMLVLYYLTQLSE